MVWLAVPAGHEASSALNKLEQKEKAFKNEVRQKILSKLKKSSKQGGWTCSIGYRSDLLEHSVQPLVLIAFTGLAMGTRNAAVRKRAIPDLTTTVLTLTVTGIAADSSLAKGDDPRLARRVGSVFAIFFGAAFGAVVIRYSISAALALATAISVACSAALFRSLRTSDNL
jgi:uncharacterized membrane protein YoaK (UPF0700 family)